MFVTFPACLSLNYISPMTIKNFFHQIMFWKLFLLYTSYLVRNKCFLFSYWESTTEQKYGRKWKYIDWLFAALQPVTAILQTAGICILFFIALPELSSAKAALVTSLVAWFPGLLKMVGKGWKGVHLLFKIFDILSLGVLLATIGYLTYNIRDSHSAAWSLPVGLLLASFGWWTVWIPSYLNRLKDVVSYIENH